MPSPRGSKDTDFAALAEKEAAHYDRLLAKHIPYGQVWTAILKAGDPQVPRGFCGEAETISDAVYEHTGTGDGAIWTGTFLAALSYKLAATQDLRVYAQLLKTLETVETLFAVTGKKGLLARAYLPPTHTRVRLDAKKNYQVDAGEYAGYRFSSDISRDQYSGIMFGLWAAHELVASSAVKEKTERLVTEVVDHLLDNNLHIVDVDGSRLSFDPGLVEPDQALLLLSFVRMAALWTGESKYTTAYEKMTTHGSVVDVVSALDVAVAYDDPGLTLLEPCHFKENYYRFNFAAPHIFALNLMDDAYGELLQRFRFGSNGPLAYWDGTQHDKNALFDLMYAAARGGDATAEEEAMQQLVLFPAGPRRKVRVSNPGVAPEPSCENIAVSAIDVDRRPANDYLWRTSPYLIDADCNQPWVEFSGLDYLLPYWMARYHSFFRKPELSAELFSYDEGKTQGTAKVRVQVSEWLEGRELSTLFVELIDADGRAVMTKLVNLGRPLSWKHTSVALALGLSRGSLDGSYRVRVSQTLHNLPGARYPETRSELVSAETAAFTVTPSSTLR